LGEAQRIAMNSIARNKTWKSLRDFSRRPWIVAALLVSASLVVSVSASLARWPVPNVHDEFSYLLAADTFVEGRLANPPHPHWQHFESFHIIQQPTYASKYPPGMGLVLAAGQSLTGEPVAGLWMLTAVTTAACYWMLLGWTSPRWALLGGVVMVVHPGYQLAWGQLFWGGTLAMLGGALVFGAALRMVRHCQVRDAVAMAGGALILATSRPFEGMVFCLLVGAWVLIRWARAGLPAAWTSIALKTALPQAAILLAGGAWLAYYNHAVTGDALTMPYKVHEVEYGQAPVFHGQSPAQRSYRHPTMEQFHDGHAMDAYREQQTLRGFLRSKWDSSRIALTFFVPTLLGLPLALMLLTRPQLWARGRLAAPLAIGGLALLASLACYWNFPHYLAPMAPMLLIALVAGLRYVDAIGRRWFGVCSVAVILIAIQACLLLVEAVERSVESRGAWQFQRARILADLEQTSDRHLVLVRYEPQHNTHEEWVYNRANIDDAKVVWAREIDAASDAELIEYFADRKVWLLEPDSQQLRPWDAAARSSRSFVTNKENPTPVH
jgi:hypothetical protein